MSASYSDDDFVKTVLSWPMSIFRKPLAMAVEEPPLPQREVSVDQYYANFLPFILEEARAIIAAGLEKVALLEATPKYGKKKQKMPQEALKLNEAKAFQLTLKQEPRYPKNDGNPLSMRFKGVIPEEIEHGGSMNVLLLILKDRSGAGLPEKKILGLASESFNDARELFVKIIIPWEDYQDYESSFTKNAHWQAHYLGSVISESRMYETCLLATDTPCVRRIAQGVLSTPHFSLDFNMPSLNLSQRRAVSAFLNAENYSVLSLQGPPGTGKTTTLVQLLGQVSRSQNRILVSAHSNKGVQVLASRAMEQLSDIPMILVGVESKVPEALKPLFLDRWHDMIDEHLSVHPCSLLEMLAEGKFSEVNIPLRTILSNMREHLRAAQKELSKFGLILKKSNYENRQDRCELFKLMSEPFSTHDFEYLQALISKTEEVLYHAVHWRQLVDAYSALQSKWQDVRPDSLKKYLLNYARVVFATLITSGRDSLLDMEAIDYLLVDEAAQSVEAATLIPMRYRPKKVLLVGDTKQLPATVISELLDDNPRRGEPKYYKRSMMWRLIEENEQPNLMLTTQYRMHPHICQWPSAQYYENRLITAPDILPMQGLSKQGITSRPYAIYQVQGADVEDGRSICNHEEAKQVVNIIRLIEAETKGSISIGVITPYTAQKRLITEKLKQGRKDLKTVDVNTVDGFQGDERDVIIISFTRTHVSEFLREFRRLNVAITRPKFCLIILASPGLASGDMGELMQDAKRRGVLYSEVALRAILNSRQILEENPDDLTEMTLEMRAWHQDAESQFLYGKGMERFASRMSMVWIRRAAENGHAEAQYCISQLYCAETAGEMRDIFLGASWLQKSANQGFVQAQYTLGTGLLEGKLFVKNIETGVFWCKQAAAQDYIYAILFLARSYEEGIAVYKNEIQAMVYYRQAAKLENLHGMLKLAELLFQGHEENQKEAIKWYRKLAERGQTEAYYPLAYLLANILERQGEALKWFVKAADNGYVEAQYEVGLRFREGRYGCRIDLVKAAFYFRKSAIAGHCDAQFAYAVCSKEGAGVTQDRMEAMIFFKRAADKEHLEAQYQYAQLKEKESEKEAYVYYKKAANRDHLLAQRSAVYYQVRWQCDLVDSFYFCKKLVERGQADTHIRFLYARLLDSGLVREDKRKAYTIYTQLSEEGYAMAHYYAGLLLEESAHGKNTAEDYYKKCAKQIIWAELHLARLMLEHHDCSEKIAMQAIQELHLFCDKVAQEWVVLKKYLELDIDRQIDYLTNKDRKFDLEAWIFSINSTSNYANYTFGMMFKRGDRVKTDYQKAMFFLKKAGDNDCVEAQYQYAELKVSSSSPEAYVYYKKAAIADHSLAQHACIHHQLEHECDLDLCIQLCDMLAHKEDFSFQFVLARLLDSGIAGHPDKKGAYHHYAMATKKGHRLAPYYAATLLEQGIGIDKNIDLAIQYYRMCADYYFKAKLHLAFLLLENKEPHSEKEAVFLLKSYYERYVDSKQRLLNDKEQCLEKIIIKRTGKLDRKQRVVQTDCMEAHFYLGRLFEEGKGVNVNVERALFHYECAAKSMPEADYRMGYMYEFGVGEIIGRDSSRARTYYQRAADKGHELAAQRLTWSHAFLSTFVDIRDSTSEKKQEKDCLVM